VLLENPPTVRAEVVSTIDHLSAMRAEWLDLWNRAPAATPFQSPAWLIPWAQRFTNGTLATLVVRANDRLVGLVPAHVWQRPETGARELLLLGGGISDYTDALVDPEHSEAVVPRIAEWLNSGDGWDIVNFEDIPRESPLVGFSGVVEPQQVCPVLMLPRCPEALADVVPASQLRNLHYYRRRANLIGPATFEIAAEETVSTFIEELFALSSARWHGLRRRGVLDDEMIRDFHREAAPALLEAGTLRLHRMRIRDKTAAVLYALSSHRQTCYYLAGFDPRLAHISPGTLLIGHAIRRAIEEGCAAFDFLRGSERYKYLWGARDTQTYRLLITREELTAA